MRITRYDVGMSLLITTCIAVVVWLAVVVIQRTSLALSRITPDDIEHAIRFTEQHYRFFGLVALAFIANYVGHIANRLRDLVGTLRDIKDRLELGAPRKG